LFKDQLFDRRTTLSPKRKNGNKDEKGGVVERSTIYYNTEIARAC
jgi:hypothetical protein